MKLLNKLSVMLAATAILAVSCDDNDNKKETVPPAQITDVTFTPQAGGGYFLFSNPKDADFLYTRAEYIIDTGEKISKTSSAYSDTLFIEGFGSVKEYEVKLYAVDRNNNASEPVIMNVTPLQTATESILSTVDIKSGFSSLGVSWKNETQAKVDVYVKYEIDGKTGTKVQASNLKKDNFDIPQLEGRPYKITVWLTDNYGNKSSERDFGQITPKEDIELDKEKWSFLSDSRLWGNRWDDSKSEDFQAPFGYDPNDKEAELSIVYKHDSLKNSRRTNVEGRATKFIDGEIDDPVKLNLNYFHTGDLSWGGDMTKGEYGQGYGWGLPGSYFYDMGEVIQASRIKVWQRNWDGQLWGGENPKTFQIYISNDSDPVDGITDWQYVGEYTFVKPSNEAEAKKTAKDGPEWLLYPDDPRFTPPFRYIRFKFTKLYGGNSCCCSEMTLFGQKGSDQPYAPSTTPVVEE